MEKESHPHHKHHQLSILERMDIFGIAISIRFNHFKSHKTYFGGFMTIVILGLITFQIVKIAEQVFKQTNPTVIEENKYVYSSEKYKMTSKDFNLAIGIQDEHQRHFKDESLFTIRATQQSFERVLNSTTGNYDQIVTLHQVALETCTLDHFSIEETFDYFSKLPYTQFYCLALNETQIGIEGEISASKFQSILFEVVLCQNSTNSQNCSSPDMIYQKMMTPQLEVFFSDVFVNVTNRNKPYYHVGRSLSWPSSIELTKEVKFYLQNNYIQSDFGYLQSNEETVKVVSYSSAQEGLTIRRNKPIFNFVISYEKNLQKIFKRSYLKLDTAFAQIGGFFNALIAIGYLICLPISQIELDRKVINQSFRITQFHNYHEKDKEDGEGIRNAIRQDEQLLQKQVDQLIPNGTPPDCSGKQHEITCLNSSPNHQINYTEVQNGQNQHPLPLQLKKVAVIKVDQKTKTANDKRKNRKFSEDSISYKQDADKIYTKPNSSPVVVGIADQSPNSEKQLSWMQIIKSKLFKKSQKNHLEKTIQSAEHHHQDIQISFFDYFLNYFGCCESHKSKLIREGTDVLYSHIDIFYIINKLSQIDKLKHILLSTHQNNHFNTLPFTVTPAHDFYRRKTNIETTNSHMLMTHDEKSPSIIGGFNFGNQYFEKMNQLNDAKNDNISIMNYLNTSQNNNGSFAKILHSYNLHLQNGNKEENIENNGFKSREKEEEIGRIRNESLGSISINLEKASSSGDSRILPMVEFPHTLNTFPQKLDDSLIESMKQKFKLSDQILEGREIESIVVRAKDYPHDSKDQQDQTESNDYDKEDEDKCHNMNQDNSPWLNEKQSHRKNRQNRLKNPSETETNTQITEVQISNQSNMLLPKQQILDNTKNLTKTPNFYTNQSNKTSNTQNIPSHNPQNPQNHRTSISNITLDIPDRQQQEWNESSPILHPDAIKEFNEFKGPQRVLHRSITVQKIYHINRNDVSLPDMQDTENKEQVKRQHSQDY